MNALIEKLNKVERSVLAVAGIVMAVVLFLALNAFAGIIGKIRFVQLEFTADAAPNRHTALV